MERPFTERAYSGLLRRVALPVAEAIQGMPVQRHLAALERSQWWSPAELRALQEQKLQAMVAHAVAHVPFYRDLFAARGLRAEDIYTVADLRRLPILTKEEVRAAYPERIVTEGMPARQLLPYSSSGSTGEPFRFVMTREEKARRWAALFRFWRWTGWDFGVPYAIIERGAHLAFKDSPAASLVERYLTRVLPLPAFGVYDGNLSDYVKRIHRFHPAIVRGYSASIAHIAEYLAVQGERLPLRAALTTGETLLPEQRALISDRFACPVFDGYGGEGMEIAFECERHEGWHLNAEGLIAEVVDDEGRPLPPGELGQLVLTNLSNAAMPFIRYNIQDLAALGAAPCSCGRGLPLLTRLEGRLVDVLVAPNGRRLVVQFFTRLFRAAEGVGQFQVIQSGRDLLRVKLVTTPAFNPAQRAFIERELQDYVGPQMAVRLELVDDIPPTLAGKRRFMVREEGT
ncbi:MAG: phenylacetate--CoA ligase family protein [Anaerolineae bacterium]|nr:phenylacetate--CoA ligase family protein [Anaerolineae bacterium]